MKRFLVEIGKNIQVTRKTQRLSQERLAERAGLHPTYIGRVERAEVNITIGALKKISDALEVSLNELLFIEERSKDKLLIIELAGLLKEVDPKTVELLNAVLREMIRWEKRYEKI
jgi:transcriptional regulator with XRE-family HTH domain